LQSRAAIEAPFGKPSRHVRSWKAIAHFDQRLRRLHERLPEVDEGRRAQIRVHQDSEGQSGREDSALLSDSQVTGLIRYKPKTSHFSARWFCYSRTATSPISTALAIPNSRSSHRKF
jgi:hypothetical protein